MNHSKGKYYIKRNASDTFVDITEMFDGVAVLSLDGFNERGEALNVYHAQWIDSQEEDFLVANENNIVIRSNVDLNLTIVVSERYKSTTNRFFEDVVYDDIIDYLCNHGAFYIKSTIANRVAKVVCLNSVKPTSQRLNRGVNGYILVTITLHALDSNIDMRQWEQLIENEDKKVYDTNDYSVRVMKINDDPLLNT